MHTNIHMEGCTFAGERLCYVDKLVEQMLYHIKILYADCLCPYLAEPVRVVWSKMCTLLAPAVRFNSSSTLG